MVWGRGPTCLACVVTFMWWDAHVAFTPPSERWPGDSSFFFFVPEEMCKAPGHFYFSLVVTRPVTSFFSVPLMTLF